MFLRFGHDEFNENVIARIDYNAPMLDLQGQPLKTSGGRNRTCVRLWLHPLGTPIGNWTPQQMATNSTVWPPYREYYGKQASEARSAGDARIRSGLTLPVIATTEVGEEEEETATPATGKAKKAAG